MATESRKAHVASVELVAEEVARVRLAWEPGQSMSFKAGQWTILQAREGDRVLKRCFSIASSPSDRDGLTYYVERTGVGGISEWLHICEGGEEVEVRGPHGKFPGEGAGPLLLVAFDTGISPAWSVLQDLAEREATSPVRLLYGWSRAGEAPLTRTLLTLAKSWPALEISILPPDEVLRELPKTVAGMSRAALAGRVRWLDPAKAALIAAGMAPERIVEEPYDRQKG